LKALAHQFIEGDAQNWWHEHNDFGIRTAFSDQQLWLPYVVGFYIEAMADNKILDEAGSYMKAPLLDFLNNSHWAGVPEVTVEKYSLYDHCLRAIERTFVFGENGLPLIGNGDWNDGLNKVGEKGQGESVWLGWFLYYVINQFIPYIKKAGDEDRVKRYEITANNLKKSLEHKAWDGKWYKRAFFDNGNPLGSHSNKEFKRKVNYLTSSGLLAGIKAGQFFTLIPGLTLFATKSTKYGRNLDEVFLQIKDLKTKELPHLKPILNAILKDRNSFKQPPILAIADNNAEDEDDSEFEEEFLKEKESLKKIKSLLRSGKKEAE
jgi:hypothetical protein